MTDVQLPIWAEYARALGPSAGALISALVAATVGVVGWRIAKGQQAIQKQIGEWQREASLEGHTISKEKLKHDLFDRRIIVLELIVDISACMGVFILKRIGQNLEENEKRKSIKELNYILRKMDELNKNSPKFGLLFDEIILDIINNIGHQTTRTLGLIGEYGRASIREDINLVSRLRDAIATSHAETDTLVRSSMANFIPYLNLNDFTSRRQPS